MAHEFKPGDLALVINSQTSPEAVGSCVVLKEAFLVVPLEGSASFYRVAEAGDANPIRGWLVEGEFFAPGYGALERNLMPLKGDEQPAQVRQAERVQ